VSRRILLMLLAFTAIVLVGAVVPLTLNATSHDRNSFIDATADTDQADAAIAQERLDGNPDSPLFTLITETQQQGSGLLILATTATITPGGQVTYQQKQVDNKGMPPGQWIQLADQVDKQAQQDSKNGQLIQPMSKTTGSWVISAIAVISQGALHGPLVGTVILARSTQPLDHEILELWVILGSIAAAAMLAAAVLAFGLARWVSRPLKGLDAAARRLADGDLAIRAKVQSGPPELRRLGTTFNTMAGRLEALVHGNRAVIADVSHQLRTPLAALRLRLDLLAADAAHTDPDTGRELAEALDELARLSRLVDGLLAVARAENAVPVPTKVDVDQVARERVSAWHPVADDRCIVLVISPAPPVLAWIGEGHLEQILDNLIANALDALSPGNLVRLTVAATPTGARITVADNGPGMSAEDRERAFLRWFTNSSSNGTGLGLAIVHRLVTSNGGTARLDQTPGGGLTVTLNFPGVPTPNGGAGGAGSASGAGGAPAHGAGVQDIVSL
jgi:signal transduction histidine kinase